jgi:hypothetical protein
MKVALHRRLTMCLMLAYLVGLANATAGSAAAATTLRWKFKQGQTIYYEMQQDMEMAMNMQGREFKTSTSQVMDMTWRVAAVNSDGTCEMRQTFERIRFTMEGPTGRVEYDSSQAEKPDDPVLNMVAPMFEALVGADFTMKMDALGNVSNVTMPEKFRAQLANNPAGQMTGMNEDSMKQMLQQAALVLPEKPVAQNDTWNSALAVEMPFGVMKSNNQMTYLGPESSGSKKFEKIGIASQVTLEPKADSPLEINISKQNISGTVQFDNAAGYVEGTTMQQEMVMEINAGGQKLEQVVNQTMYLKRKAAAESSRQKS